VPRRGYFGRRSCSARTGEKRGWTGSSLGSSSRALGLQAGRDRHNVVEDYSHTGMRQHTIALLCKDLCPRHNHLRRGDELEGWRSVYTAGLILPCQTRHLADTSRKTPVDRYRFTGDGDPRADSAGKGKHNGRKMSNGSILHCNIRMAALRYECWRSEQPLVFSDHRSDAPPPAELRVSGDPFLLPREA